MIYSYIKFDTMLDVVNSLLLLNFVVLPACVFLAMTAYKIVEFLLKYKSAILYILFPAKLVYDSYKNKEIV